MIATLANTGVLIAGESLMGIAVILLSVFKVFG